eukprot:5264961-Pyramimonas_sp.AAC.1
MVSCMLVSQRPADLQGPDVKLNSVVVAYTAVFSLAQDIPDFQSLCIRWAAGSHRVTRLIILLYFKKWLPVTCQGA